MYLSLMLLLISSSSVTCCHVIRKNIKHFGDRKYVCLNKFKSVVFQTKQQVYQSYMRIFSCFKLREMLQ